MKRIIFFLSIIAVLLISCNEDDPIEVRTSLPITIAVEVPEPAINDQESGQTEYSFTASQCYHLSDNKDVKDYLDNMKYIDHKGYSIEITGLEDGEVIKDIVFSVEDKNKFEAFENVTKDDYGTRRTNDEIGYAVIHNVLLSEKQLTITVTGTTNKAPMDFDVDIQFEIGVLTDEI
ncbi:hypothetical protein [uncultured Sunxiuqinia sp.]|uniref:hypothetical protein n=1 Tax=uncultured Sunxiuqinia sp. TaxID=1573825 RepID=UPI0026097943|nr:hypothetical protein [uncultured Sunxiuqinia sp.]